MILFLLFTFFLSLSPLSQSHTRPFHLTFSSSLTYFFSFSFLYLNFLKTLLANHVAQLTLQQQKEEEEEKKECGEEGEGKEKEAEEKEAEESVADALLNAAISKLTISLAATGIVCYFCCCFY